MTQRRQLRLTKSITDRTDKILDQYIKEISRNKLLTTEEENLLAVKIKDGDEDAMDKLIVSNLRFVISVAKQYQHQGLDLMDLIGEGNLGLITAAKNFDETRGFKFISFAVWYVRQSIFNSLSGQARVVRLPLNRIANLNKVSKAISKLQQRLQHDDPPIDVIAEETWRPVDNKPVKGLTIKEVSDSIYMSNKYVSLDAPLEGSNNDGEEIPLVNTIQDEVCLEADYGFESESLIKEISRALSTLQDKEREVVAMFYGIGYKEQLNLDEISKRVGLTRERARQVKEKGVRKLRHHSRSHLLKQYL